MMTEDELRRAKGLSLYWDFLELTERDQGVTAVISGRGSSGFRSCLMTGFPRPRL